MGNVLISFTMSLDGYVAGPDIDMENAMGRGGDRLHQWMFSAVPAEQAAAAAVKANSAEIGAVILGRRTFDIGLQHWDNATPYPAPSFVLTHRGRAPLPTKSGTFSFLSSIDEIVRPAKAAAGSKAVVVMGASVAQQLLRARLADALFISVAPVLLGGGTRLFDNIGSVHIDLRLTRTLPSEQATHLWFDVRSGV